MVFGISSPALPLPPAPPLPSAARVRISSLPSSVLVEWGLFSWGAVGSGSAGEEIPNTIAYNNAYVEDWWGAFRHAGAMRIITRKASAAGVKLPSLPIEPKRKACPAYHIKGVCNTGCGNAGDHATHTREQDIPLWEWAVRAMPEITAPLAPVA